MVSDSPRLNAWITSELIILVLFTFLFLFLITAGREHSFVSWKAILATREQLPVPGEYGGSPFTLKLNAPAGTAGFHLYSCHF